MARRVLDWAGLLEVAQRRDPTAQHIQVAGLPAQAKAVRAPQADPGFYVKSADAGAQFLDQRWSLRRGEEIVLLRQLVAAGQVTIDDPAVPDRCAITGCASPDIDTRGPVHLADGTAHLVCGEHWRAVFSVVGEQDRRADDHDLHVEQITDGTGRVLREVCAVCGGTRGEHLDDRHDLYDARQAEHDRMREGRP